MKNNNLTHEARQILMKAGYYVGNLWHVDDVQSKFEDVSDYDAQDILDEVLTSHWIIEKIQESITEKGDAYFRIDDQEKEREDNERD